MNQRESSRNHGRSPSSLPLLCGCLILAFTLLLPGSFSSTRGVSGTSPALTPGQWAHYSLTGNESGGAVDALFTVQSVNGPNVTFTDLDTFQDNHTATETIVVSISIGPTIASSGEYFVISPQTKVGDPIYPDNSHYHLPIQDLSSRSYAFANRQIAHVHAQNSSTIYVQGTTPTTTYEDFYWDQSTGIFTEIVKILNGQTVLHVAMSSTSIWPPGNPLDSFLVPSAVVSLTSAGIIGVILVGRYRKKAKLRH